MKEIVLIGSYCDTQIKLDILEKQIDDLKLLNIDILVFGRYPLPPHIQKKCDYFIFDKSNPILEDRTLYDYLFSYGKEITYTFQDYGYAALEQIIKSLGFVNSLNYDIAHWLVYDVDVAEFYKFRDLSLKKLKNYDVLCHKFSPKENILSGIDGTSISFKIQTSYDKLKGIMTKTFYKDLINRKGNNFISEDFMEECFRVSEVATYIVNPKPNLPAILSSSTTRKHGVLPRSAIKSSKYFKRCFIGWDTDINSCVIRIDNILKKFDKIELQIKDNMVINQNVEIDKNGGINIIIDRADMLKIISINREEINEVLDLGLDTKYYKMNTIKNAPRLPSQVLPILI